MCLKLTHAFFSFLNVSRVSYWDMPPKKKSGRPKGRKDPALWNSQNRTIYLDAVKKHLAHRHCLGGAGWSAKTWARWMTDASDNPESQFGKAFLGFLSQIEKAKRAAAGEILDLISDYAKGGDALSAKWLAERVHQYEKVSHITNKVEATVTHEDSASGLMDRLARIAERIEKKADS